MAANQEPQRMRHLLTASACLVGATRAASAEPRGPKIRLVITFFDDRGRNKMERRCEHSQQGIHSACPKRRRTTFVLEATMVLPASGLGGSNSKCARVCLYSVKKSPRQMRT